MEGHPKDILLLDFLFFFLKKKMHMEEYFYVNCDLTPRHNTLHLLAVSFSC